MKLTLLDLVQTISRSINGEEINSVSDSAESLALAGIVKECYYEIVSNQNFPELKTLFELNASTDNTKPTLMTLPTNVVGMDWLKYDKRMNSSDAPAWDWVKYIPLPDFLAMNHELSTDEDNVGTMTLDTGNSDSIDFFYRDDKAPDWYTSFDDTRLIFDSYRATIEDTLVKEKTMAFGLKEAGWSTTDSFIPELDSQQVNILLKEAKAMAWLELRQTPNVSEEKKARKAKIRFEKNRSKANYPDEWQYWTQYQGYGRK